MCITTTNDSHNPGILLELVYSILAPILLWSCCKNLEEAGLQPTDIFGGKRIGTCCCTWNLHMFFEFVWGVIARLPHPCFTGLTRSILMWWSGNIFLHHCFYCSVDKSLQQTTGQKKQLCPVALQENKHFNIKNVEKRWSLFTRQLQTHKIHEMQRWFVLNFVENRFIALASVTEFQ